MRKIENSTKNPTTKSPPTLKGPKSVLLETQSPLKPAQQIILKVFGCSAYAFKNHKNPPKMSQSTLPDFNIEHKSKNNTTQYPIQTKDHYPKNLHAPSKRKTYGVF